VRITVLGKSPSWQDADGACSGYLIEEHGKAVVLDCGSGVFAKLRRFCDYTSVDAVVITHLHADHFLDLVPFAYALTYAPRQQPGPADASSPARPRLIAPPGARETFRRVCGAWGSAELIEDAFELCEYDVCDEIEIGTLRVRFQLVPHYLPTHAVEIASTNGGGRFTFGADCSPTEALTRFADGTDLLMVEATLTAPELEGERGHLTPSEAGEHGRKAHARRLVITHFSDELDEPRARGEASRAFGAPVEVAAEGAVYIV
jgi:ribonuclease BN (tRNA processing enzyme)